MKCSAYGLLPLWNRYATHRGLVPSLKVGEKCLYESVVLLEYFDEQFPDTPQLLPKDPYERAL